VLYKGSGPNLPRLPTVSPGPSSEYGVLELSCGITPELFLFQSKNPR